MSPHNDPALQLLWLATLEGFGLEWPLGERQLLIVSAGTGHSEPTASTEEYTDAAAAKLALPKGSGRFSSPRA